MKFFQLYQVGFRSSIIILVYNQEAEAQEAWVTCLNSQTKLSSGARIPNSSTTIGADFKAPTPHH